MNTSSATRTASAGEAFAEAVGASEAEVAAALRRWRGHDTFDPSGKGYFDRLA
jgi:hypothetical protein